MRVFSSGMRGAGALSTLFLFGACAAPPVSTAAEWAWWDSGWPKITASKGSLEEQLETVFGQLSTDCAIWPKGKLKNNISQIPAPIKKEANLLGLSEQVHAVPFDSANRLMSFLFASDNLNGDQSRRIDNNNYVFTENIDLSALAAPRVGSDTLGYRHTCSSYLAAALDAGSSIPMASVSAALKTESKETANLVLIKGTFENPLYLRTSAQDLPTLLRFWKAYAQGNGYSDNLRIIKGFSGVLSMRVKSTDRSMRFNVGAKSNVDLPMLSASLSSSAEIASSNNLLVSQYLTYVYANVPTASLFAPAPAPSQVKAAFALASIQTGGANGSYLFTDKPFEFWADIDAIPKDMCNVSSWDVLSPSGATTLANSNYRVGQTESGVCRFTITGDAPSGTKAPDSIVLDYQIASRKSLQEKKGSVQLVLPGRLRVQASDHPAYRPPAAPVEGAKYGSGAVNWSYQLDFFDTERAIDSNRLQQVASSGQPVLACKDKSHALVETISVDSGARIRLTLRPAFITALTAGEVCTLKGLALRVPAVNTTALLTRPIEAELLIP